jgi:hypothetical protein
MTNTHTHAHKDSYSRHLHTPTHNPKKGIEIEKDAPSNLICHFSVLVSSKTSLPTHTLLVPGS